MAITPTYGGETTTYKMVKPELGDKPDIGIVNANMDIIDEVMTEFKDGKAYFAFIPEGADLNDPTYCHGGTYNSPDTVTKVSSLINKPSDISSPFVMLVRGAYDTSKLGPGSCVQVIINDESLYVRRGTTAGFGAWVEYSRNGRNPIIPNDTDLNDILGPGVYSSPITSAGVGTIGNRPAGVSLPFTLIVSGSNAVVRGGCVQTILRDSAIFTRRGTSSAWTHWFKFEGTDTGA